MRKVIRNKSFRKEILGKEQVSDFQVNIIIQNWLGVNAYLSSNEMYELRLLLLSWLRNKRKI